MDFIPSHVKCGKKLTQIPLNIYKDNWYLISTYFSEYSTNKGGKIKKEYSLTLPRYINYSTNTFEVLGLLKAEMGKTDNGCINFSNCDFKIINKVIRWFDKEIEIDSKRWKWYIKLNINSPEDEDYKKQIEDKVLNYWLSKTNININQKYPKSVCYIKNTNNKRVRVFDYGTLVIEIKSNLLSQIIKNYVKLISLMVPNLKEDKIQSFMKGVIAGEGCVGFYRKNGNFRVLISSSNRCERDLYQTCLNKLRINSIQYNNSQTVIISNKKDLMETFKQKLMCLNQRKYNKFLTMIKNFKGISFLKQTKPWNKLQNEKVMEISKLYEENTKLTCRQIAEKTGISFISVNRIMRKNNFGKRMNIISKPRRIEIVNYYKDNLDLTQKEIASIFKVSESVVGRAIRRYFKKNKIRDSNDRSLNVSLEMN